MSDMLRKLIKELIEEELDETTSSSAAGPYNTPFAFRGNSAEGKAKQKKNANQAGYEMVKGQTDDADSAGDPEERVVKFGDGKTKKPMNEIGDKKKCHRCSNMTVAKDGICGDCRMKDFNKDFKNAVREDTTEQKPAPRVKCKSCDTMISAKRKEEGYDQCSECARGEYEFDEWARTSKHWKPKNESTVNEGRYTDFKMSEGHPRQKIGKAIREINKQLHEIDKTMKMNARLKKESGLNNDQLWKSTVRGLSVLEGRLNTLATRIREMKG